MRYPVVGRAYEPAAARIPALPRLPGEPRSRPGRRGGSIPLPLLRQGLPPRRPGARPVSRRGTPGVPQDGRAVRGIVELSRVPRPLPGEAVPGLDRPPHGRGLPGEGGPGGGVRQGPPQLSGGRFRSRGPHVRGPLQRHRHRGRVHEGLPARPLRPGRSDPPAHERREPGHRLLPGRASPPARSRDRPQDALGRAQAGRHAVPLGLRQGGQRLDRPPRGPRPEGGHVEDPHQSPQAPSSPAHAHPLRTPEAALRTCDGEGGAGW